VVFSVSILLVKKWRNCYGEVEWRCACMLSSAAHAYTMLTRGVYYIAAFTVASVAVVGYAVLNQLSFPVACALMILFTGLLALATDVSFAETDWNGQLQMSAALSNHLQTLPVGHGTLSNRKRCNLNDSNNANCARVHSDVELATSSVVGSATISARSSASGYVVRSTDSSGFVLPLPQATKAERLNCVQLFSEVPSRNELRRPPIGDINRVTQSDSIQVSVSTSVTPCRSELWTADVRSQQHILPQFQHLTTGCVVHVLLC